MVLNEIGLWRLIDERIRYMGLAPDEFDLQAYCVDIVSYHQTIPLGQDTAVLVSTELDIPYTAQVILDGGNNKLETSKSDYEKLSYAGYQFFQDQISVTTSNFGIDFTPYRLEFIRISPNKTVNTEIPKIHIIPQNP
jgi:hypothetical protein